MIFIGGLLSTLFMGSSDPHRGGAASGGW